MIHLPIHTERLTIRRFTDNDLQPFLDFMLDPDSTKFLAFSESQTTENGAKELFQLVIQSYGSTQPIHSYAVIEKQNCRYIGSCGFADYDTGIVEIYFSINPEYRGQGFAIESTVALIAALNKIPAIHEIRAYCHPDNLVAHSVAQGAGLIPQGRSLHQHFGMEGELFSDITGDRG